MPLYLRLSCFISGAQREGPAFLFGGASWKSLILFLFNQPFPPVSSSERHYWSATQARYLYLASYCPGSSGETSNLFVETPQQQHPITQRLNENCSGNSQGVGGDPSSPLPSDGSVAEQLGPAATCLSLDAVKTQSRTSSVQPAGMFWSQVHVLRHSCSPFLGSCCC